MQQSSLPNLLECIEMRHWQKAIDIISVDSNAVYARRRSRGILNNNDNCRLAIHELCKIASKPTSVRFSKDEFSDDEEEEEDDEDDDSNETAELDKIFDACELEEGTKIYEVTQYMIDMSHSLGPTEVAAPCNNNNNHDENENENRNINNHIHNHNNIDDLAPRIEEQPRMLGMLEGNDSEIRGDEIGDYNNDDEIDGINNNNIHDGDLGEEEGETENDENNGRHSRGDTSTSNNNLNTSASTAAIHESILTVADSMGKTPLHILCENSCDSNMMRVILESTREVTGNPFAPTALSLILAKDSRGSTPLHYLAYSRQCPFSSLKLIMDYCKPRSSSSSRHCYPDDTTTTTTCNSSDSSYDEKQQQQQPQSSRWIDPTLCTDEDGETPLHWALDGYMSPRRILELTRHSLDAIMVRNQKGKRPFDQFTSNFVHSDWTEHDICGREAWDNIQEYLRAVHHNYSRKKNKHGDIHSQIHIDTRTVGGDYSNGNDHDNDQNSNNEQQQQQNRQGESDSKKSSEWLPLHFIAAAPFDFPPVFTDLALKYGKGDLQKADRASGKLPLHFACERKSTSTNTPVSDDCLDNNNSNTNETNETENENITNTNANTDSVAIKILKAFPRASMMKVTTTNQLALHIAVQTQQPMSLIAALIRTYPRSLNIQDPITKLLPYALAGVEDGKSGRNSNCNSDNNESLSVSFSLLRADPSVLHLVKKSQRIRDFTNVVRPTRMAGNNSDFLEKKAVAVDESYMEHSSRRIRRLTIR